MPCVLDRRSQNSINSLNGLHRISHANLTMLDYHTFELWSPRITQATSPGRKIVRFNPRTARRCDADDQGKAMTASLCSESDGDSRRSLEDFKSASLLNAVEILSAESHQ